MPGHNCPDQLPRPCFTTEDDKLLFQDKSLIGGTKLRIQNLASGTINPQGNPGNIILAHKWGTWFNNGTRVLTVATRDAANPLAFSVSPNPTIGSVRMNLNLPRAVEAQCIVTNLLGQVQQQRKVNLAAGENQLDLDLQALPAGTYLVRLSAGDQSGVAKVIKQ